MTRKTLLTGLALVLAGCSSQSPAAGEEARDGPTTAASASPAKEKTAIPVTARAEAVSTDSYSFSYSYPSAAGVIPGVKEWLDADLAARKSYIADLAKEGRKASQNDGFPFNPYDFELGWDVVTDLPAWLSLSASFSTYTGGAHPNHGFDALLWDKRAGKMREATELFQSERAFSDVVRADFCKALDKERAEKRDSQGIDGFDECIEPTEAVIILGSSNGKAFNRIGFLIAPYIAGPYVEGTYEVTLPVTEKVLSKVKAEFRPSFVVAK
ncbi:MAG: DUF3298 and DUF4163 domain-containing protein [Novosphingobium sp.]|nr:DUF3298 and DUF4163 domain-containing protein [Novosphingobium sp.]